jgi:light-regulated signal transduction histidine kinase (bacteriophytochrome)
MDELNEHRRTRAALLEMERRITELQTANEELQSFCFTIAHDLQAPIRHVSRSADLLQTDSGWLLSEPSRQHLTNIVQMSSRMRGMIDDLLEIARLERCEICRMEVDLNQLVEEALADFRAETKNLNIEWEIRPLPSVHADPRLLRRALDNLISNAIKFTGFRAEPQIIIGSAPGRVDETVLFISDNGAGFDPKRAGKLFNVFQRLHGQEEFPGTGVGLAIVRRIIDRHGGRAWAQGEVDCGATFFIAIPKPAEA